MLGLLNLTKSQITRILDGFSRSCTTKSLVQPSHLSWTGSECTKSTREQRKRKKKLSRSKLSKLEFQQLIILERALIIQPPWLLQELIQLQIKETTLRWNESLEKEKNSNMIERDIVDDDDNGWYYYYFRAILLLNPTIVKKRVIVTLARIFKKIINRFL